MSKKEITPSTFSEREYANTSQYLENGHVASRAAEQKARRGRNRAIRRGATATAATAVLGGAIGGAATTATHTPKVLGNEFGLVATAVVGLETVRRVGRRNDEVKAHGATAANIASTQRWLADQTERVPPAWASNPATLPREPEQTIQVYPYDEQPEAGPNQHTPEQ